MAWIKEFERSSKWRFMWLLARMLKARPLEPEFFRNGRFGKILVIRQHNQMGDMILAIPAFRAIKNAWPDSPIGVLSTTLNRGVLVNNPYVDDLYLYDKKKAYGLLPLIRDIRRERYDLVIVLHTVSFSFTSVALAVLSGARYRVGSTSRELGDSLTGSYLNLTLPLPDEDELARMCETEHNLYPLREIGAETDDLSPVIVPTAGSERWAKEFDEEHWRAGSVRLAVHPGAGKTENIWPPQNHAEVVNELARTAPVGLVVVEGPRDEESVAAFLQACDVDAAVVRGRGIGDVAALLRRADLVVCNDTGVMHVAAAAGATTLAVFGPTDPFRWAPRSPGLSIVRAPGGRLADLTPERVATRAREIIGAGAGGISSGD
jgi:ADP-heptose:LPS heptosyltransferase